MAGAEEVKHLPLLVRPEKAAVFISTHDKPGRTIQDGLDLKFRELTFRKLGL